MRRFNRISRLACISLISFAAAGDETGVLPRVKPSDYPAHKDVKAAVLAAAIIPSNRVEKMFSADIAKGYIVVEVCIYPEEGHSFDVDPLDFAVKIGDQAVYPSQPREVAIPWPEKNNAPSRRGPAVVSESGVVISRYPDPYTGRPRTSVGTYEGVGVSNDPAPPAPTPPPKDQDPAAIQAKLQQFALAEGLAAKPVAGYLYFRRHSQKRDSLILSYSRDGVATELPLQK